MYAPVGFFTVAMVKVAAVLAATVQPVPRVTTTVPLLAASVLVNGGDAVHEEKPVTGVIAGVVEFVKPVGDTTVMVSPATSDPELEVVKPTVQVEVADVTVEPGLNDTSDVTALAIVAVPRSTMAMTMAPAVNLLMRLMGLKPDESSCPTTE